MSLPEEYRNLGEAYKEYQESLNLFTFKVEMTVTVPAKSEKSARESLESWEKETQDAIGGLSFVLEEVQRKEETDK